MRKLLLICSISALTPLTNIHAQEVTSPHRHSSVKPVANSGEVYSLGGGGQTPNSTGFSGTGANINVVYHRINWTIDPNSGTKTITGTVVTYFKTIVANVATVTFDLNSTSFPAANVTVTYHGTTCSKTCASNILTITLPSTIVATNTLDSVVINYTGIPPGVVNAAEGYQAGGATTNKYIMTLSESYEDRDWWPCKADMQDKIDSMDINVTVPWITASADTFWVATNGVLYDSTITGSNRTFKFRTRYPIPSYLVAVSVAKFTRYYRVVNINGTNTQVAYYLLRNTASQPTITAAMDKINGVVTAFSAKFGDYPFKLEKHGFYDGLLGAGGMEHQTFSGIANNALTDLKTLAHELTHQWFGDNVSFATWNDLWLAEGFANYGEALSAELVPALGLSAFTIRSSSKTSALGLSSNSAWIPNANMVDSHQIWDFNYGSTVYVRGGMIVSMLRSICGDNLFFQALTNYQTTLKGKSATTDTLKNYFNAVLGTDISGFFKAYVGGTGGTAYGNGSGLGNPVDTVFWNSPSANRLVLQVGNQTRTNAGNTNVFEGPVVVHVKATGKDTTIVFYDWGSGNLSYAGNGLSAAFPGNSLYYDLSFTPTSVLYDDSARTMSTGGARQIASFKGYTWLGGTSTAWNTASNWAGGVVPPSGAQVIIATTVNAPTLPGSLTVGTLSIAAGTKLTIGAGNTLTINGPVTGTGTIVGSPTSNIIVNGTPGTHLTVNRNVGALYFDQTSASTRSLNNLTVNPSCIASIGNALDIYGTVNVSTATLNLAGTNLTLKSTSTATARIADLTGSTLTGATNVTVERYISDVGRRAWRLLSVPVTGSQTIKQAWQENGVTVANLGTNITSNLYNGLNGFDAASVSSSILTHNQGGVSGPSWNYGLANTGSTLISAFPAYMIFVRGDRNATSGNGLHAFTVLRATGTIKQGTQSAVTISSTGTGYTLVGNPYPSPIDFETISGTANLNQNYYIWDPTLTGNNGVGGYRFVQRTGPGVYQQTPVVLGGSPVVDPTLRYIHSGQGFFLKATGANASVVFAETSKAALVSTINPFTQGGAGPQQLVVNLMVVNADNSNTLADGFRVMYDDANSASVIDDNLKIGNFGENISSYREGKSIIVENRPMIGVHDTIFIRMTNTVAQNYRYQVGTLDFAQPDMQAWLEDAFLGTRTLLNLDGTVNYVDFVVTTDPASSASNRFRIVFAASTPLPVDFKSISATLQTNVSGQSVSVDWKVANQANIKLYDVERSADGLNFTKQTSLVSTGINNSDVAYNWIDINPLIGLNYYRIRSEGKTGEVKYSDIAHVQVNKWVPGITVAPNPVTNKQLSVQFNGMEKGVYQLKLVGSDGQVALTRQVTIGSGSNSILVELGNIASGNYYVEIIKPDHTKTIRALQVIN